MIGRAAAVALMLASLRLQAAPLFRNAQPVLAGVNSADALRTGDFNNDGHDDVLVFSEGFAIAVLLDTGRDPLSLPVVTPVQLYGAPAVADFNGDGRLDVMAGDVEGDRAVAVLMLGRGDGSFFRGPSFATPDLPRSIAAGDFNGDHRLDVAIVSSLYPQTDDGVTLYYGDGAGHFSAGTTAEFLIAKRVTAADLNGDGRSDLLVDSVFRTDVLLTDAIGTLRVTASLTEGDVAVGDFNRDGRPDVAISASDSPDFFVEVDLGNGDGTFAPPARYVAGYASGPIVAADVDRDGNVDLLTAGFQGSEVTLLRGTRAGTFRSPEFFMSGPGAYGIAVSDFDRDGKLDFVTADRDAQDGPRTLSFVRGNGDGTFQSYRAFHTRAVPPSSSGGSFGPPAIVDVDGDGKPDVVGLQDASDDSFSNEIVTMRNDGHGALGAPVLTSIDRVGGFAPFAAADVDRDGKADVVIVGRGNAGTYLGNGDGTFRPPVAFVPSIDARSVSVADFDGDGVADLLLWTTDELVLQHGNGDGTFAAAAPSAAPGYLLVVADINGDARPDLVAASDGGTTLWLNDGHGHFSRRSFLPRIVAPLAVADFDGDRNADILAFSHDGLAVWFGDGRGAFNREATTVITPLRNTYVGGPAAVGDFNGDGKMDVAFATEVYTGNGDGTFGSRSVFRTTHTDVIAAADMDGNGTPDLVFATRGDDVDVLLTMPAVPPPTLQPAMSVTASAAQAGRETTVTAVVRPFVPPLTGVVRFEADGRTIALIEPDPYQGIASVPVTFDRAGTHVITATYTGDDAYAEVTMSTRVDVSPAPPRRRAAR